MSPKPKPPAPSSANPIADGRNAAGNGTLAEAMLPRIPDAERITLSPGTALVGQFGVRRDIPKAGR
jgi:hypothetical protein